MGDNMEERYLLRGKAYLPSDTSQKWTVSCDITGDTIEVCAPDSKAAARAFLDGLALPAPEEKSVWVMIHVSSGTETYCYKGVIHPEEPPCSEAQHTWDRPLNIVGGIRENPGVWGHGAGFIIREFCHACHWQREIDTWATDPTDGEQELTSIHYTRVNFDS